MEINGPNAIVCKKKNKEKSTDENRFLAFGSVYFLKIFEHREKEKLPITPLFSKRSKSQTKHTVLPLKIDTANIEITIHRIEIEKIVLNTPRSIGFEWIDYDAIGTQVRYIRIRIITTILRYINNL